MDKQVVVSQISVLKAEPFGSTCLDFVYGTSHCSLILLTKDCRDNLGIMDALGRWRKSNEEWFQATFPVTVDRTTRWFENGVIAVVDRMLFIIKTPQGYLGHVGLFRFNFIENACEIDNIVRGIDGFPGIMQKCVERMMVWGEQLLGIKSFRLQTTSDNPKALSLYRKMGFVETKREPLVCKEKADGVEWIPATESDKNIIRYNVFMNQG